MPFCRVLSLGGVLLFYVWVAFGHCCGSCLAYMMYKLETSGFVSQNVQGFSGPKSIFRNVSNARRRVSSDIQTLRSRLKKRGAAEFFETTSRCLDI